MDLKKLPPSMLVLLGLGCPGVQACLSPPIDSAESSSSEVETDSVGPCLSPPQDSTETDVGPCLDPPIETFGTDTGSSSGTDSGSSSGTDSGSSSGTDSGSSSGTDSGSSSDGGSTIGPCLAPPPIEPDALPDAPHTATSPTRTASSRREALERVMGALPTDVAARLRRALD